MYLDFFNMKEEPFSLTPNPRYLYLSPQHEEALEALVYGIEHRKGFITLIGEIGTGKTTVCRALIQRLGTTVDLAVILNPLLSVAGLLKAINKDFGLKADSNNAEELLEQLNEFLLARVKEGRNAVVLIDESQNLSRDALEMTRLLSNLETNEQKLLQIILVGQPELEKHLKDYNLRQLAQRITIRRYLKTLSYEDTCRYIDFRLQISGATQAVYFEPRAVKFIHRQARGYPRLINAVCDRSLLEAYARRSRVIDKKVVKEAVADISGGPFKWGWRSCPLF